MFNNLLSSPLFKGLTETDLDNLFHKTHYNIIRFNKGEMIALAGDPLVAMMIILEGQIKTEVMNESGKSLRMEDFACSKVLAPGFIFGQTPTFPVNVIAKSKTSIMVIPKSSFVEMLSKNHVVLINFLDILSNKTQFLVDKIKSTFLLPIEGKIASYLISISDSKESNEFDLPQSHKWLAEKFGVTRPSVARVFSKMNTKGFIEQKGKHIKILNKNELIKCTKRV